MLLGVGGGLLVFMLYDLPLVEFVAEQNIHWVRFVVYTVVIFAVLVNRCRPQAPPTRYWTALAALLLLHFVGSEEDGTSYQSVCSDGGGGKAVCSAGC